MILLDAWVTSPNWMPSHIINNHFITHVYMYDTHIAVVNDEMFLLYDLYLLRTPLNLGMRQSHQHSTQYTG